MSDKRQKPNCSATPHRPYVAYEWFNDNNYVMFKGTHNISGTAHVFATNTSPITYSAFRRRDRGGKYMIRDKDKGGFTSTRNTHTSHNTSTLASYR